MEKKYFHELSVEWAMNEAQWVRAQFAMLTMHTGVLVTGSPTLCPTQSSNNEPGKQITVAQVWVPANYVSDPVFLAPAFCGHLGNKTAYGISCGLSLFLFLSLLLLNKAISKTFKNKKSSQWPKLKQYQKQQQQSNIKILKYKHTYINNV